MAVQKIKEGIYSVGVQNPGLRVFDIIMRTEFGTTYNAYLVKGSEKTALIETVHTKFFDEYIENLEAVCDPKTIDYVVLNHTEPDHSGSLRALLEKNPDITVIASTAGLKNIANIANMEVRSETAKDGVRIDLGGKTLEFIIAPMLHWPDSMFTYVPEDAVLFPCDFLGAHFCEPRLFDKYVMEPQNYEKAFFEYYSAIFGPFKSAVLSGLDKIKGLKLDVICPSHGPVLTERIAGNMEKYRKWSEVINQKNAVKKIAVFYVSAYGCTEALAMAAADVIKKAGLDCELYDVIACDPAVMKEAVDRADGIMLGSPTINRDALKPIWDLISGIDAVTNRGKLTGIFGSYGWSGEAVPMLVNRINDLKLKAFEDGLKVCFVPSETELAAMCDYTERYLSALA